MRITETVRQKTTAYGMLLLLVLNLFSKSFAGGAAVSLAAEAEAFALDENTLEAEKAEAGSTDEKPYSVSARVLNGQEKDGSIYTKNALQVEFEYILENESTDAELFWTVVDEDALIKAEGTQVAEGEDNKKYTHQELFSVGSGSYILYYGLRIDGVDQITKNISVVLDDTAPELKIDLDTESEEGKRVCIVSIQESNFESGSIDICRRTLEGEENWSEPLELKEVDEGEGGFTSRVVFEQDGIYTIQAAAVDKAGNQTETQTVKFIIDNSPPVLEFDGMENGGFYNDRERTLTLRYTDLSGRLYEMASASVSGPETEKENLAKAESLYRITVKCDDGMAEDFYTVWTPGQDMPYLSKTEIVFGDSETNESIFAQEGKYTITFYGQDAYGNKTEEPAAITFVIDRTAPDIPAGNLTLSYADGQSGVPEPRWEENTEVYYFHGDAQLDFQVEELNYDSAEIYIEESRDGSVFQRREPYGMKRKEDHITVLYDEEGCYTARIWAKDKAGNYEGKAGTDAEVSSEYIRRFVVDKTAPVISNVAYTDGREMIMQKFDNICSNHAILVEFQIRDQVSGVNPQKVYVTVGSETERTDAASLYPAHKALGDTYYVYVPTDLNISELNDTITIWANDMSGNEAAYTSANIIYQTGRPYIQMECDVDYTKWTNQSVIFETTVTDATAGLKEIVYKIDGKVVKKVTFKEFTTRYSYTLTAADSADKVTGYPVSVEVTNNCGTTAAMKKQVYIDKVKPRVRLSGIVNGTHYNTSKTFITDVEDVSYKDTKTVYYIKRTLDGKQTSMSAAVLKSKGYEDAGSQKMIQEGSYEIYAITTDSAGNRTVSNTLRFVIDKTAPKLSISGVENDTMNGTEVCLEFGCEESFFATNKVTIAVDRVLDGKESREEIDGFPLHVKSTSMSHTFTEDGTYEVTMSATDKAGNKAMPQTIRFHVDQTKPVIRITGTDNYEQWDEAAVVRFEVEEAYYSNNVVTIHGTRTDVDGNVTEVELPDFVSTGKVSSLIQKFAEDGRYEFEMVSKDEAGNWEGSSIHFTVDRTAPEIREVLQYQGGCYQYLRLGASLEDIFKDLTVISCRILLNGIEYDGISEITEEGKYTLDIEARDELGHISREIIEFIIDHTPPKVHFSGVKDGETVHESGVVTLSLTNTEDKITDVRMNGVHYGADVRSLSYREYGSYQIDVDCVDEAGNAVTRSLYFVYSNPAVHLVILRGAGILVISILIWLWIWTRRKGREEGRNV